jgi:hypothetical protein
MTKQEKIIYLAGFFEGEGTICISNRSDRKSFQLRICVGQKDIQPLPLYVEMFGGHIYPQKRKGVHCINQWDLKKRDAQIAFLKAIYPYLITKKAEADVAFIFLETMSGCSEGGWWSRLTSEKRELRKTLFLESKRLKVKKYGYVPSLIKS